MTQPIFEIKFEFNHKPRPSQKSASIDWNEYFQKRLADFFFAIVKQYEHTQKTSHEGSLRKSLLLAENIFDIFVYGLKQRKNPALATTGWGGNTAVPISAPL